jgi:hypothetical protein
MYLRRVRVVGLGFAAALAHVSRVLTPPALRQKNSAWASGDPAGGKQTCGGVLGTVVRIAPARPATPRSMMRWILSSALRASRLVAASPVMRKSWGTNWGKQLPGERPRETAET